ncbi:MAG: hypothetical protein QM817_35265 [Archangium sp.]
MTKSLEETWRALVKETGWRASPLRRFVHFEKRPCLSCDRTPDRSCVRCRGKRSELASLEREFPASHEACALFARSVDRFTVVEDAARERLGATTQRLLWKTAAEVPFGAETLHRFDEASVLIEGATKTTLTLVALGVSCRCHEPDWQNRPVHATRWIGTDDHHADVTVDTCTSCGALWLEYFFEDHFDNGSRYRGLISATVADQLTPENAAGFIAQLPWYWLGGTYHFGKVSRSAGPVLWR